MQKRKVSAMIILLFITKVIGFINMVAGTKVAEKPENTAFVLIVKWI